jgi:hypothetical protein
MKLTFKSATSHSNITIDFDKKTYLLWNGFGSNGIIVSSNKELQRIEIELVKGGFHN